MKIKKGDIVKIVDKNLIDGKKITKTTFNKPVVVEQTRYYYIWSYKTGWIKKKSVIKINTKLYNLKEKLTK